jgi:hypothetical protein
VLIDASSSQRSKDLIGVLNAAKQFVGEIVRSPQDRVFVLTFDATQHATEWLKREEGAVTRDHRPCEYRRCNGDLRCSGHGLQGACGTTRLAETADDLIPIRLSDGCRHCDNFSGLSL